MWNDDQSYIWRAMIESSIYAWNHNRFQQNKINRRYLTMLVNNVCVNCQQFNQRGKHCLILYEYKTFLRTFSCTGLDIREWVMYTISLYYRTKTRLGLYLSTNILFTRFTNAQDYLWIIRCYLWIIKTDLWTSSVA